MGTLWDLGGTWGSPCVSPQPPPMAPTGVASLPVALLLLLLPPGMGTFFFFWGGNPDTEPRGPRGRFGTPLEGQGDTEDPVNGPRDTGDTVRGWKGALGTL